MIIGPQDQGCIVSGGWGGGDTCDTPNNFSQSANEASKVLEQGLNPSNSRQTKSYGLADWVCKCILLLEVAAVSDGSSPPRPRPPDPLPPPRLICRHRFHEEPTGHTAQNTFRGN